MHSEPMLAVADVPASARFYRQLLGCTNDHGRPDFDRVVADGEVILMLHQRAGVEHGLEAPAPDQAGKGVLIWIYVDDLAAVHARASKLGAPIVVPPHDNPETGWREFTLCDPDGYHIAIAET